MSLDSSDEKSRASLSGARTWLALVVLGAVVACGSSEATDIWILARAPRPVGDVVPRAAEQPRPRDPATVEIAGQCIDVETELPVAGVGVRLRGEPAYPLWDPAFAAPAPVTAVTGEDGRFEIVCTPSVHLQFTLEPADASWFMDRHEWSSLTAGTRIELGRVALRRMHAAEVRVVDPGGRPLEGIVLRTFREDPRVAGGAFYGSHARSDADGRVRFGPPLLPGRVMYWVTAGAAAFGHGWFLHAPGGAIPDVIVEPAPVVITGTLLAPDGAPLGGVQVAASTDGQVGLCETVTDAEGRFVFGSLDPAPQGWTLDAWHERYLTPEHAPIPTGTRDLRLRMVEACVIALDVVDARDGSRVEAFTVATRQEETSHGTRNPAPPRRDAQQRVLLAGLLPGVHELVVHPNDPALAESRVLRAELTAGTVTTLRVELQPRRPVRVRVLHAGRPVVGARVDVVASPRPSAELLYADLVPSTPRTTFELGPGADVHFGSGVTGADGHVTLACATERDELGLRVRAEGFAPQGVELPQTDDAIVVALPEHDGGDARSRKPIHCTIVPPGILTELAAARERWMGVSDRAEALPEARLWMRRDDSRRREMRPVPGEQFELQDRIPGDLELGIEILRALRTDELPETTARVRDGEPAHVRFDLAQLRPSEVELTVQLDEEPPSRSLVLLMPDHDALARARMPHAAAPRSVRTDPNGRLEPLLVAPGIYRIHVLRWDSAGVARHGITVSPLHVDPGMRTTAHVTARQTVRVRMLDPAGEPLRNCVVQVHRDSGSHETGRLDVHGVLFFDQRPARIELHAADNRGRTFPWLPAGTHAAASLSMPRTAGERDVTLRLTPR